MSKFTAGTWNVDVIYGDQYVVYAETSRETQTVADCFDNEDSAANARLIAAAPEMYEFLKKSVEAIDANTHLQRKQIALELLACIDGKEETEDEQ